MPMSDNSVESVQVAYFSMENIGEAGLRPTLWDHPGKRRQKVVVLYSSDGTVEITSEEDTVAAFEGRAE